MRERRRGEREDEGRKRKQGLKLRKGMMRVRMRGLIHGIKKLINILVV
jgi:hypothetical protein